MQKKIDECNDYTEFILMDKEYNINAPLVIINKSYITIRSNFGSRKARLSGTCQDCDAFIKILDSKGVKIQNISVESNNCDKAILIKQSNNSRIINNNLNISCKGTGIYLESGAYNNIIDNKICNVDEINEDFMSTGIIILDAVDSNLSNNKICDLIYCNDPEMRDFREGICHYYIKNEFKLNTTIIKSPQVAELRWCYCSCKWDGYFSECLSEGSHIPCDGIIPDNNSRSSVWVY